jgi:Zn-dependent peptidase ImmA (M78 family)
LIYRILIKIIGKMSRYLDRHNKKMREDSVNWEANEFALKLLMPEETVRRLVDGGMKNIGDLATAMEVPAAAVIIRIEQLGYELKEK